MNSQLRWPNYGIFPVVLFILLASASTLAKDQPAQTVVWPQTGTPIVRFTFSKFKETGAFRSERTYVTDTTAENLWTKPIPEAAFSLYLYDKNNTRIGEGYISLSNVGRGQVIKFQTTVNASGTPASVSLTA